MANYKVAQDVEAEDKLLGPFGFRQFIYLVIVGMAGIVGYGLFQLFPPLVILPLPIILLFGALALPLRKDQPMETYLAAIVSYYIKPRRRLWKPDGVESIVEITAPKVAEESLVKAVSGSEADRRLGYLADLADTRGWAIRHSAAPPQGTSMLGDVYNDAQATVDVLDDSGGIAQAFDNLINKADVERKSHLKEQLSHPELTQQQQLVYPSTPNPADPNSMLGTARPQFNPYPSSMHQSVIQPLSAPTQAPTTPTQAPQSPVAQNPYPQQPQPQPQPQQQSQQRPTAAEPKQPSPTSEPTVSPDIMNLANNSKNLSVETIAHEAQRLREKEGSDEVVISLR